MIAVSYYGLRSIKYLIQELKGRNLYSSFLEDAEYLIRWGSRKVIPVEFKKTVNMSSSIENASNKLNSIELFHENNIPCVASTDLEGITFPCFVFAEKHAHGNGLVFLASKYDYNDLVNRVGYNIAYWSPLLPVKQEYRAHVCNGEVLLLRKIFMGKKLAEKEYDKKPTFYSYLIRNRKAGYVFYSVKKWSRIHDRLCQVALDAIKALGLVFGAVDLCTFDVEGEKESGINVFEVNSGPSLSPRTAKFYADNIIKYFVGG